MAKEKENPLTREDVIDAIARNGGSAWNLDLSEKEFKGAIDLRDLNLSGIILNKAVLLYARFDGSNLKWAKLREANLQHATFNEYKDKATNLREADLSGASLNDAEYRKADLWGAQFGNKEEPDMETPLFDTDLRGANLQFTSFSNCIFFRTKLEGAFLSEAKIYSSQLEDADWGSYKIGEEISKDFYSAENIYRRLKQWYTNAGKYDIAGEFFFREMTAQRNRIKWWPHPTQRKKINWWLHPRHRAWSKFVSLICGYGERPQRVIGWAASVVLVSALIYFVAGSVWEWPALWNSLYFSAVSFTALGYGSWLQTTNDWIRGIGAFESFVGVFTIALFLITFTRKMRR